jgi:hypothetical protein
LRCLFKILLIGAFIGLFGCESPQELEMTAELSMPFIKSCSSSIDKAEYFFENKFKKDGLGFVEIERVSFLGRHSLPNGVNGYLNIKIFGELKLLSNITEYEYAVSIADSIVTDCFPYDRTSVNKKHLDSFLNNHERLYGKGYVIIRGEGDYNIFHNKKDVRAIWDY